MTELKRNMNVYVAALTIGLSIVFMGCEQQLTADELPDYEERIVINGVLSNNGSVGVEVSSTGNPYREGSSPEILPEAEVRLEVNGAGRTINYNSTTQRYESGVVLKPGDRVFMSCKNTDHKEARVAVTLPERLEQKSVTYTENGGIDVVGLESDRIDITFKDDNTRRNYYAIKVLYYQESALEFIPFEFPLNDPSLVSASTFKLDDGTYIVKDDLFRGEVKTFSIVAPFGFATENADIRYLVELSTLSEDYWNYIESLNRYRDGETASGLFNSAVKIKSNIIGGLGILGAQMIESDTLR